MLLLARPILLFAVMSLCGCTLVKVSPRESLQVDTDAVVDEAALLDVGIEVFTPLQEELDPEIGTVIDGLRFAESRYLSWQLASRLRNSGYWGRVSLQPQGFNRTDLEISGSILQSDGQTLRLHLVVRDAARRTWFERQYVQIVNSNDFTDTDPPASFAFLALFNRIANDLLTWRTRHLDDNMLVQLRNVTDMQFARELAPGAYGDYLRQGSRGLVLARLPSREDPIYTRIAEMRQRNDALIDTLQDRYDLFVNGIERPYLQFLDRSLGITEMINEWLLQEEYNGRYEAFLDKDFTESFETRFSTTRSPLIKSRSNSLNSGWRTEYYAMALAEAGLSLDELVRPESEVFNDRIVSLTNGAGIQYSQWKLVLDELYALESGASRDLQIVP